jgi:CDGSH-type Zn-finger protein
MKITCLPNGPYRLSNGSVTALCRCGGSAKKPLCDGTHARIGFSDESPQATGARETYAGKSITLFDNRSICAHAGVCTDRLKSVFRMDAEPWIDPDAASVEAIAATIAQCPSGALSYATSGAEWVPPARAPNVTATKDGPYAVTGGVELAGIAFGEGASREHYTLCRCGASKNKPFCDGAHWHVGFKASRLSIVPGESR